MPNPQRSNTGSSTHLSPTSPSPAQPAWPAPRSPLPPHRLAKLANALGVSTPVPATHASHAFTLAPTSPTIPTSSVSATFSDVIRRSPTPSAQHQLTPTASTSKYLLHVVPPYHLPHDVDELELTPPPPSASGYHTQFRRGVLVPVYSTLQAQLGAIAREYALPSTVGMILYLITNLTPGAADEPGPRISEDIWRHIFTRVLKAERDEATGTGPKPLGLGFGVAGRSSPALLQDIGTNHSSQSLRALISPRRVDTPQPTLSPSPATSVYSSQSDQDAESPESATSVDPSNHSNSLPLPGLESPALVPILAKVEFDVDKRKAGWYDPWVRSRRMNNAKRAESRLGLRSASRLGDESAEEGEEGKRAPMDLTLVEKMERTKGVPGFLLTKDETDESEEHGHGEYQQIETDDDGDKELTARLNGLGEEGGDPLGDVFGGDAEMWAEMHASEKLQVNPNVVELALDAQGVSRLPENLEEGDEAQMPATDGQAEVSELLKRMSKPALSVSIPSSPPVANRRRSSPTTAGTIRRHVPPPLDLLPSMPGNGEMLIAGPSPMVPSSAAESVQLAYLQNGMTPDRSEHPVPHDDNDEHEGKELKANGEVNALKKARSPEEEKRDGAFFDDLDLGLDASLTEESEYDESDPFDHRRSQVILAAQLDEIEKNLAQFSPRRLQSEEITPEEINHRRMQSTASARSFRSMRSSVHTLSPRQNADELSPPPKTPMSGASWPAVPYSMLNGSEKDPDEPPSPPKFAFNGISTEIPYQKKRMTAGEISDETLARQRALAEERGLYPPLALNTTRNEDSPIIPLSPDPFGRFPSMSEAPLATEGLRDSQHFPGKPMPPQGRLSIPPDRNSSLGSSLGVPMAHIIEEGRPSSQTPSSRFSLDSVTSEEATKAVKQPSSSSSLMSVKSIRRLWTKSSSGSRSSISGPSQPENGRTSPNPPPLVPETQPVPAGRSRTKSISRPPPPPPLDLGPPIDLRRIPIARDHMRALRFDQESPYPIHPVRNSTLRSPSPPPSIPSRPPSQQQQRPPSVTQQIPPEKTSVRKSILKSWKSATGLSTNRSSVSRPPSTTPRSSTEQLPETGKKRRPGVLGIATGGLRGSTSGSSMSSATLVEIPPSPAIPEHFANHARSSSRQSQNAYGSHSVRPSMSSAGSTSSPPRVKSPLSPIAGNTPPSANSLSATNKRPSFESFSSRSSFDVSQFEIVSPPRGSLTYPYHGLDQSLVSQE